VSVRAKRHRRGQKQSCRNLFHSVICHSQNLTGKRCRKPRDRGVLQHVHIPFLVERHSQHRRETRVCCSHFAARRNLEDFRRTWCNRKRVQVPHIKVPVIRHRRRHDARSMEGPTSGVRTFFIRNLLLWNSSHQRERKTMPNTLPTASALPLNRHGQVPRTFG
jgi:hypothetical protein